MNEEIQTILDAHETRMQEKPFQDEWKYLHRVQESFIKAFVAITHYSTRSPTLGSDSLLFYDCADILESTVGYPFLVTEGVMNLTRRELRYVLETVSTHYYIDFTNAGKSLQERIDSLETLGRQPKIDLIKEVTFDAFSEEDQHLFVNDVTDVYARLCRYVHPSRSQLDERRKRREAGRTIGLEDASDLKGLNRDIFRTLDLVLSMYFHGLSLPLSGDVFTVLLDEDAEWKFHKGKWCAKISHYFDYKAERRRASQDETRNPY